MCNAAWLDQGKERWGPTNSFLDCSWPYCLPPYCWLVHVLAPFAFAALPCSTSVASWPCATAKQTLFRTTKLKPSELCEPMRDAQSTGAAAGLSPLQMTRDATVKSEVRGVFEATAPGEICAWRLQGRQALCYSRMKHVLQRLASKKTLARGCCNGMRLAGGVLNSIIRSTVCEQSSEPLGPTSLAVPRTLWEASAFACCG